MSITHLLSFFLLSGLCLLVHAKEPLANAKLNTPTLAHNIGSQNGIIISHGRVRASIPHAANTVAFLTIQNTSNQAKQLTGITCTTVAARCELHQHVHTGDNMRMEKVERLTLHPHKSIVFIPGGYHVMLLDLTATLAVGQTADLVFTFSDGSNYHAHLPVTSVLEE